MPYPSFQKQLDERNRNLQNQIELQQKSGDKIARIYEYDQRIKQTPNAIVTGSVPSYENLFITQDTERNGVNEGTIEGHLTRKLLQFADAPNADKILQRLSNSLSVDELKTLNEYWHKVSTEIRKNFSKGVSINALTDFIIGYVKEKLNKPEITTSNLLDLHEPSIPENKKKIKNIKVPPPPKINDDDDIETPLITYKKGSTNPLLKKIEERIASYQKDGYNVNTKTHEVTNASGVVDTKRTNNLKKLFDEADSLNLLKTGTGFKKPKGYNKTNHLRFIINGTGSGLLKKKEKYIRLNKFMVDLPSLENKNIINLKYVSNQKIHPKFPRQKISNKLRDIIRILIVDGEFSKDEFELLSKDDQIIFYNFTDYAHIDVGLQNSNDIQNEYDILLGEFKSGNKNEVIRNKLKSLISSAINNKDIPLKQGILLLNTI